MTAINGIRIRPVNLTAKSRENPSTAQQLNIIYQHDTARSRWRYFTNLMANINKQRKLTQK